MALATTVPAGSTNRRFYSGAIGVAGGVPANVDFDISGMPKAILSDPTMRDNWLVLARQVDPGITDLSPAVDFLPAAPAAPTTLRLSVTSDNIANLIDIEFWYINSATR